MNSVRANFCGGVEFFEKKVRGLLSQTASSQSAFNLPLIILRANLLWIIISFRKHLCISYISKNKQKYLCVGGAAAAGWPYDYIVW